MIKTSFFACVCVQNIIVMLFDTKRVLRINPHPRQAATTFRRDNNKSKRRIQRIIFFTFVFFLLKPITYFFIVYGIIQKTWSLQTWRVVMLFGSVCTGKNSGPMAAPPFFATGPRDSQTLVKRSVSLWRSITQACGLTITAC